MTDSLSEEFAPWPSSGHHNSSTERLRSSPGLHNSSPDNLKPTSGHHNSSPERLNSTSGHHNSSPERLNSSSGHHNSTPVHHNFDSKHLNSSSENRNSFPDSSSEHSKHSSPGRMNSSSGHLSLSAASSKPQNFSPGRPNCAAGHHTPSSENVNSSPGYLNPSAERRKSSSEHVNSSSGPHSSSSRHHNSSSGLHTFSSEHLNSSLGDHNPSSGHANLPAERLNWSTSGHQNSFSGHRNSTSGLHKNSFSRQKSSQVPQTLSSGHQNLSSRQNSSSGHQNSSPGHPHCFVEPNSAVVVQRDAASAGVVFPPGIADLSNLPLSALDARGRDRPADTIGSRTTTPSQSDGESGCGEGSVWAGTHATAAATQRADVVEREVGSSAIPITTVSDSQLRRRAAAVQSDLQPSDYYSVDRYAVGSYESQGFSSSTAGVEGTVDVRRSFTEVRSHPTSQMSCDFQDRSTNQALVTLSERSHDVQDRGGHNQVLTTLPEQSCDFQDRSNNADLVKLSEDIRFYKLFYVLHSTCGRLGCKTFAPWCSQAIAKESSSGRSSKEKAASTENAAAGKAAALRDKTTAAYNTARDHVKEKLFDRLAGLMPPYEFRHLGDVRQYMSEYREQCTVGHVCRRARRAPVLGLDVPDPYTCKKKKTCTCVGCSPLAQDKGEATLSVRDSVAAVLGSGSGKDSAANKEVTPRSVPNLAPVRQKHTSTSRQKIKRTSTHNDKTPPQQEPSQSVPADADSLPKLVLPSVQTQHESKRISLVAQPAVSLVGQADATVAGQATVSVVGQPAVDVVGQVDVSGVDQAAVGVVGQAAGDVVGQAAVGVVGQAAVGVVGQAAVGVVGQAAAHSRATGGAQQTVLVATIYSSCGLDVPTTSPSLAKGTAGSKVTKDGVKLRYTRRLAEADVAEPIEVAQEVRHASQHDLASASSSSTVGREAAGQTTVTSLPAERVEKDGKTAVTLRTAMLDVPSPAKRVKVAEETPGVRREPWLPGIVRKGLTAEQQTPPHRDHPTCHRSRYATFTVAQSVYSGQRWIPDDNNNPEEALGDGPGYKQLATLKKQNRDSNSQNVAPGDAPGYKQQVATKLNKHSLDSTSPEIHTLGAGGHSSQQATIKLLNRHSPEARRAAVREWRGSLGGGDAPRIIVGDGGRTSVGKKTKTKRSRSVEVFPGNRLSSRKDAKASQSYSVTATTTSSNINNNNSNKSSSKQAGFLSVRVVSVDDLPARLALEERDTTLHLPSFRLRRHGNNVSLNVPKLLPEPLVALPVAVASRMDVQGKGTDGLLPAIASRTDVPELPAASRSDVQGKGGLLPTVVTRTDVQGKATDEFIPVASRIDIQGKGSFAISSRIDVQGKGTDEFLPVASRIDIQGKGSFAVSSRIDVQGKGTEVVVLLQEKEHPEWSLTTDACPESARPNGCVNPKTVFSKDHKVVSRSGNSRETSNLAADCGPDKLRQQKNDFAPRLQRDKTTSLNISQKNSSVHVPDSSTTALQTIGVRGKTISDSSGMDQGLFLSSSQEAVATACRDRTGDMSLTGSRASKPAPSLKHRSTEEPAKKAILRQPSFSLDTNHTPSHHQPSFSLGAANLSTGPVYGDKKDGTNTTLSTFYPGALFIKGGGLDKNGSATDGVGGEERGSKSQSLVDTRNALKVEYRLPKDAAASPLDKTEHVTFVK